MRMIFNKIDNILTITTLFWGANNKGLFTIEAPTGGGKTKVMQLIMFLVRSRKYSVFSLTNEYDDIKNADVYVYNQCSNNFYQKFNNDLQLAAMNNTDIIIDNADVLINQETCNVFWKMYKNSNVRIFILAQNRSEFPLNAFWGISLNFLLFGYKIKANRRFNKGYEPFEFIEN